MKDTGGNLASVGLPRLLDLIRRKADGAAVLDIIREPVKKRFYFKGGLPVAATSNILSEVLGRLLMEEGIITQMDYERSLEVVLKEKRKHGEVLISMGLLKPDELEMFLSLQLKKRLWKIFSWNEGTYRYTRLPSVPEGISVHPIDPVSLILEGISVGFYPAARMKENLRDWLDRNITLTDEGAKAVDALNLNLQEKRFLASLDGVKTLREVLEASDLLRHRALSLVLTYMVTGLIEGAEEPAEVELLEEEHREAGAPEPGGDRRLNAELLFMKARSAVKEGDFDSAIGELERITELNPREGEYWAYLGWATYNRDRSKAKDAEKVIKDAIDLNNDLDSAWYFLGMIMLAQGNLDLAERSLRTALAKNPWMLESLSELKRLELKKTLPPLAHEQIEKRAALMGSLALAQDPFEAFPGQGHLLVTDAGGQAVEAFLKAVRKKTGAVIVSGGPGAGKTTFLLEALKKLSGEKVLASIILDPPDTELKLMHAINAEVGSAIESSSVKEQLLSFGMRVSQNRIQGGHTLIIIDRAHLLTDGCLKLVQYLCRLKSVQIALFSEPALEERLGAHGFSELASKVSTRIGLAPLSRGEVREFVLKRVLGSRREGSRAPEFDPGEGELEALYSETLGIPKLINEKAASILAALPRTGPEKKTQTDEKKEGPDRTVFSEEAAQEFVEKAFKVMEEEPFAEITREERELPPATETQTPPGEKVEGLYVPPGQPEPPVGIPTFEAAPEKRPRRVALRLFFWVVVMLVLGLIAGSLIGIYWSNRTAAPPETTIMSPNGPAPGGSGMRDDSVEVEAGLGGSAELYAPVSASAEAVVE